MKKTKISVVTICYNSIRFIEKTIVSVLSQDYSNIEYIIIDGGSTDGTVDVIKKHLGKISVFVSEPDKGLYDAMNKGIKKASGDWICFMNSSDCFMSKDVVSSLFQQNIPAEVNVIYGDIVIDRGDKYEYRKALPLKTMTYRMPFSHQATFVRRDLMLSHLFDLQYKISADYNLFYTLYFEQYKKGFAYSSTIIALCDGTDCYSTKNRFPMWLEFMKIRSAHKDIRWHWDNLKNWIKINVLGYKIENNY